MIIVVPIRDDVEIANVMTPRQLITKLSDRWMNGGVVRARAARRRDDRNAVALGAHMLLTWTMAENIVVHPRIWQPWRLGLR